MLGYTISSYLNAIFDKEYRVDIYASHVLVYTYYRLDDVYSSTGLKTRLSLIIADLDASGIIEESLIYQLENNVNVTKHYKEKKQYDLYHNPLSEERPIYVISHDNFYYNSHATQTLKVSFLYEPFYFKNSLGIEISDPCNHYSNLSNYATNYTLKVYNGFNELVDELTLSKSFFSGELLASGFSKGFSRVCRGLDYEYTSDCSFTGFFSSPNSSSFYKVYVISQQGDFLERTTMNGTVQQVTTYLNQRINHHKEICKNKNKIPTDCCILVCCEPDKYILVT